jgi:hypothetical protein
VYWIYLCMFVFMYVYLLAHVALVSWVELIKSWILNLEQIKNVFILYIVWGELLQNFVYFGKLLWYCTDGFFKIKKNTDIQYLTKAKLVKKKIKKKKKKPICFVNRQVKYFIIPLYKFCSAKLCNELFTAE